MGAVFIVALGPGGDQGACVDETLEHIVLGEFVAHAVVSGAHESAPPGRGSGYERLESAVLAGPVLQGCGDEPEPLSALITRVSMGHDSQVEHVDHVASSHAPLDAESQVLAGELIDDVTDREHTPLPVGIDLDIDCPHLPVSTSRGQGLGTRRGGVLGLRVDVPAVNAWRRHRSSTCPHPHHHEAFSPRLLCGLGKETDPDSPAMRSPDAERTLGQSGRSQPRVGAPGLEVSLCKLTQRNLVQFCLAQQLFETRVLLAQLTRFLGLTATH